jgi:hypothetical protein
MGVRIMPIVTNMTKAKDIAHEMRRAKRAEEFAPHDEVIMKQIPGADADAAEAARVNIRTKYETVQTDINDAINEVELRNIVENM